MAKDKKKDKKKAKKNKAAKLGLEVEGKVKKDGKKAKAKLEKKTSKVAEALKAEVQKAGISLAETEEIVEKKAAAANKEAAPKKAAPAKQDAPATAAKHATAAELTTFEIPSEQTLLALANMFKIFSDPTRLKILFSLVNGPRCVADIAEAAGVTQGATSHQLRSMKQEHLVDFERDGKQVFYSLSDNRVQALLAQGLSYIDE